MIIVLSNKELYKMKMTNTKMKKEIESHFSSDIYRTSYNREEDSFRIEWRESSKGLNIKLAAVVAKYNEKGEQALTDIIEHVTETLRMMNEEVSLVGQEKHVFPVIRSTSFPQEKKDGKNLVTNEHTAETRVFYALDHGKSYRLIDEKMLKDAGWTKEKLEQVGQFNIRALSYDYKTDRVADNDFYFIATQDGYDASRILNEAFLEEMKAKAKGNLAVATPHQDVLILADIENDVGYDILAQMTMKFFTEGRIPITSLSFIYDNKKLEPIFILAKNKKKK